MNREIDLNVERQRAEVIWGPPSTEISPTRGRKAPAPMFPDIYIDRHIYVYIHIHLHVCIYIFSVLYDDDDDDDDDVSSHDGVGSLGLSRSEEEGEDCNIPSMIRGTRSANIS